MTTAIATLTPNEALLDAAKTSGRQAQKNGAAAETAFEQFLISMGLWNASHHLQEWREKNEIGKKNMTISQWKEFGSYLYDNGLVGHKGSFITQPYFQSTAYGLRDITPDFLIYRNDGSDLAIEVKSQTTSGSVDRKMYELAYATSKKVLGFEFHVVYEGDVRTFGRTLVDTMASIMEDRAENPRFRDNFGGFQNLETMGKVIISPTRSRSFEMKYFYDVANLVEAWGL